MVHCQVHPQQPCFSAVWVSERCSGFPSVHRPHACSRLQFPASCSCWCSGPTACSMASAPMARSMGYMWASVRLVRLRSQGGCGFRSLQCLSSRHMSALTTQEPFPCHTYWQRGGEDPSCRKFVERNTEGTKWLTVCEGQQKLTNH